MRATAMEYISAYSLVGFSQDLSASQQCFPLTPNQHQPGLSAQKPTSEQAICVLLRYPTPYAAIFLKLLCKNVVGWVFFFYVNGHRVCHGSWSGSYYDICENKMEPWILDKTFYPNHIFCLNFRLTETE